MSVIKMLATRVEDLACNLNAFQRMKNNYSLYY